MAHAIEVLKPADIGETGAAQEASKVLADLFELEPGGQAELSIRTRGNHGAVITVPLPVIGLLSDVLGEIAKGNKVIITGKPDDLTTQQAADILQVSRPYIVKLLKQGKIPFHMVGKFRRIPSSALAHYKLQDDAKREQIMQELMAESAALGLVP